MSDVVNIQLYFKFHLSSSNFWLTPFNELMLDCCFLKHSKIFSSESLYMNAAKSAFSAALSLPC